MEEEQMGRNHQRNLHAQQDPLEHHNPANVIERWQYSTDDPIPSAQHHEKAC